MKYTTVSIPEPLNKKIKKLIKNTGFSSTSAFVIFVLREVLAGSPRSSSGGAGKASSSPARVQRTGGPLPDREKIREHLKALGYM